MPHPFNQSHPNVLNTTDMTLTREDSLNKSLDSEVFLRKLHRRSSLLRSDADDSYKRLPLGSDESYKRLPTGDEPPPPPTTMSSSSSHKRLPSVKHSKEDPNNDSFRRLPVGGGGGSEEHSYKRLPLVGDEPLPATASSSSHRRLPSVKQNKEDPNNESFKRLPSMSRRNSTMMGVGETPIESQELKRQPSMSSKGDSMEGGRPSLTRRPTIKDFANTSGDLLRQSSITRRNSIASNDETSRPSLVRKNSIVSGLMKAMRWTEESESDKRRRLVRTWDEFNALYKRGAPIGKGAQGTVLHGVRLSDNLPVVIKLIEEHIIKPWNSVNKLPVSAYLLRLLNNPEEGREDPLFAKYIDHFHIEKTWILVTEYEEHEWIDLFDYVRQRKTLLSEGEALRITAGVATALSHLHAMGFTHNDIKENNVLVHRESLDIKLIDLCSCREISSEPVSPNEFAGTLYYAAPEVRTGNFFSPSSQDVYALGMMLLLILFGGDVPNSHLDKESLDPHTIGKSVKDRDLDVSSVTVKFLQTMLSRKETKRPGILDVVDFSISSADWTS